MTQLDELLCAVDGIRKVMEAPVGPNHVEEAKRLTVGIAHAAPQGVIVDLAVHLLSSIEDLADGSLSGRVREANVQNALKRLKRAIEAAGAAGRRSG